MSDSEPKPAEAISPSPQDADFVNIHPGSLGTTDGSAVPDNDPKANDSHQSLKIITLVGPDKDHVDGEQPDVDIVHVMGIKTEDERLDLASFISTDIKSRRRESVFSIDVASLVTGDFAIDAIEHQAEQLLEGLSYFRRFDINGNPSGRGIVFVAYELGGLIVKKAISMAGVYRDRWPGIFSHSARFIFCGCFQRSHDIQTLELKIYDFLYSNKSSKWDKYLSPISITGIARAAMEINEIFLSSRVTLCSRVISLYAGEEETREEKSMIHPVFDYFTATLGLAVEMPVQEQNEPRFPDVPAMICDQVKQWVPHAAWESFEQTLVSLALPHRQSCLQSPICSHPILESPVHKTWAKSRGVRILYIEGDDHRAKKEAAEQVLLSWQTKQREKKEYWAKVFSFSFSSRDPSRDTIDDMITSLLLQVSPRYDSSGVTTNEHVLMDDQFHLQRGWTETDLLRMFSLRSTLFIGSETLLLLQDIDQCKRESLTSFWRTLQIEASGSEYPLRLVVTSRENEASLIRELGPDITVDTYTIPAKTEGHGNTSYYDYVDSWSLRLCPNGHGQDQVLRSLLSLRNLDRDTAEQILRVIQVRTKWPTEPITKNLTMLCSFLDSISRSSTPTTVLDHVLRADPDQEGLRWVLSWLLCAYRPLTRRELAMVYCQRRRGDDAASKPSSTDLQCAKTAIENHLQGIADFSHDQVCIRDDIVALFKPGHDYIWTDVKETAPEAIMDYLLQCFSSWETEGRFESMYQLYKSQMEKSENDFAAALGPDGDDIIFYAIQAFPTHLSKNINCLDSIAQQLVSSTGPFASWSKVYWAMTNPFRRPLLAPTSAYKILLDSTNLSYDARAALIDRIIQLSVVEGGQNSREEPDEAHMMNLFTEAVKAGDEEVALRYANRIIPVRKEPEASEDTGNKLKGSEDTSNLQRALWRAIWLDMLRLACVLLESGIDANTPDVSSKVYSSPLYMAAWLGHARIMEQLIKHGARVDVTNQGISALFAAAHKGHVDAVKLLAAEDHSLVQDGVHSPLYSACYWGKWRVVETLLALGADPDVIVETQPGTKLKPMLVASLEGHLRTMKILLGTKLDINTCGTSGTLNPLYLAAVNAANSESVRVLLENGADPNHELIKPPLVLDILRSKMSTNDRRQILELLVANDPPVQLNVNDSGVGVTPLMCAAANGEASLTTWLLERGADVNNTTTDGRSALFYAVNENHADVVRVLLTFKPQLDVKVAAGQSIMQVAASKDAVVDLLLNAEPSPNLEFTNSKGGTALTCAIAQRRPELVKKLLARNVNIHHRDEFGWSPIMDAVGMFKDAEMTRMLIEAGANPQDALMADGKSVLHSAVEAGPEVLRTLLEFRKMLDLEQRDKEGRTPLIFAVMKDVAMECIMLLVRAGADVNAQDLKDRSPLMWSIFRDSAISDLLLSQPEIKPNLLSESFGPALHNACRKLNIDLVAKLLKLGADLNQHWIGGVSGTPLIAACIPYRNTQSDCADKIDKIVRLLVAQGAKIDDETLKMFPRGISSPLLAACLGADLGTIRYLLDEGASIQQSEALKYLPIHIATMNGVRNFEFVAQIHRGDLLVPDSGGRNVLHWAAQFSHVETIKYILDKVSSSAKERRRCVNLTDADGWTPLAWATRPAIGGFAESMQSEKRDITRTIRYLLDEGADPSVEFRMGQGDNTETFTPLQMATLCDLGEDVMELLKHGPNEDTDRAEKSTMKTPAKKYLHFGTYCDICLSSVYGHIYSCQTCIDVDTCKKCHGRIQTYHGHLKTEDGELHTFTVTEDSAKEFQDPPEEETDDSGLEEGVDGQQEADNAERTEADANDKDDRETSEDEVDDGLNLDDLDNLEDDDDEDGSA